MKGKKTISIIAVFTFVVLVSLVGTRVAFAANEDRELHSSETKESNTSVEQESDGVVSFENNVVMENVTEHELIAQDVPEGLSADEWDSYFFSNIKSSQYALSNIAYEINEEGLFKYSINWTPMGNYIRVGLIDEDKSDMHYVICISGRAKGVIDLSQIPAGNYYVIVYNETSSNIDINGTISYNFIYN